MVNMTNLLLRAIIEYVKDNHPRWYIADNYHSTVLVLSLYSPLNTLAIYSNMQCIQVCFVGGHYAEEEYTDATIFEQISRHIAEGEMIVGFNCSNGKP